MLVTQPSAWLCGRSTSRLYIVTGACNIPVRRYNPYLLMLLQHTVTSKLTCFDWSIIRILISKHKRSSFYRWRQKRKETEKTLKTYLHIRMCRRPSILSAPVPRQDIRRWRRVLVLVLPLTLGRDDAAGCVTRYHRCRHIPRALLHSLTHAWCLRNILHQFRVTIGQPIAAV